MILQRGGTANSKNVDSSTQILQNQIFDWMHPGHLNPCDPNTQVGDCKVLESLCCRNQEWFWDELYHIAGVISPQL
jgi:hypothetical protein